MNQTTVVVTPPPNPERNSFVDSGHSWRIAAQDIIIQPLGETEFALFNAAFADSTLLNAVDACLLRLLENCGEQGLSEDDLFRASGKALDLPLDRQFRDYVRESLSQMEHMGLLVSGPRA